MKTQRKKRIKTQDMLVRIFIFGLTVAVCSLSAQMAKSPISWSINDLIFALSRGSIAAATVFISAPSLRQHISRGALIVIIPTTFVAFGFFDEIILDKLLYTESHPFHKTDFNGLLYSILNTSVIVFTITSIMIIFDDLQSKQRASELERLKKTAELIALQHQLNPHTLLNGLNNIYALASAKSKNTPEVILEFSDILRYALYETKEQSVYLNREIHLIENYIAFQKVGLSERANVKLITKGDFENKIIAPLILLPFVENAFKHGVEAASSQPAEVIFKLTITKTGILFESMNPASRSKSNNKLCGIGLDNVRARLNLIYPNRHTLEINNKNDVYQVSLLLEGDPECSSNVLS
jgi:hypothetical protein